MSYEPFALIADNLIFLPSPNSGHVQTYRLLFQKLHADAEFCYTAFGNGFLPRNWTDDEVKTALLTRDAGLRWARRSMGDFAIGLISEKHMQLLAADIASSRSLKTTKEVVKVIEGPEFAKLLTVDNGNLLEQVNWAGYTCVRDATTSCLADLYPDGEAEKQLPAWQEMIEVRYGLSADFRGRGLITRAMRIVMRWAVEERGSRRFIAETEKHNNKSAQVLERLGLKRTDTNYFQDDKLVEWATDLE